MTNKGKNNAQTPAEIRDDARESKEQGLSPHRRGASIYKVQSDAHKTEQLQALLTVRVEDMVKFATSERVSLNDIEEVKRRSIVYMRCCQEEGVYPNSLGLMRSLGYSDRAGRYWRRDKPNTETARWLEMCNDLFAEILSESALTNNANAISSIYLTKALYDFRETSEVVLTPGAGATEEPEYTVSDIKSRYILDDNSEDEE